jgi:ubiquinone biosynthesis protein
MVMVEGVATQLDPGINMWETSGPFIKEWMRTELGPEAALADGLRDRMKTLGLIPDLIKRLDESLPKKGGAPPPPPLPDIPLMWEKRTGSGWWKYAGVAAIAAAAGAAAMRWLG